MTFFAPDCKLVLVANFLLIYLSYILFSVINKESPVMVQLVRQRNYCSKTFRMKLMRACEKGKKIELMGKLICFIS